MSEIRDLTTISADIEAARKLQSNLDREWYECISSDIGKLDDLRQLLASPDVAAAVDWMDDDRPFGTGDGKVAEGLRKLGRHLKQLKEKQS